jgi:hypothetical protein
MSINFSEQNSISSLGDLIGDLPVDQTIPTHNEIQVIDKLFVKQKTVFNKILESSKDLLLMGLFFIIFSLPQIDSLIKSLIPMTNNSYYILLGVKALLFMLTYYIVSNIYLVRK